MMDKYKDWTLFLDRDGVINKKANEHEYITSVEGFKFLPYSKQAIAILSKLFMRIIVISNQQGIGKGLFTEKDLLSIHKFMTEEVELAGGRIDGIYFCPHLAGTCQCRKPKTLMASFAKLDFPEIDFLKSIVVGDSESDVEFGEKIGATTIKIGRDEKSLYDFAKGLLL